MSMKMGIIAPLSGDYNYFGIPIHNGAVLALQEAIDAGDDVTFISKDDAGRPDRTRDCIEELDEAGVVAILGPVESHNAAIGAEEARARRLPVITPSATASYLTAEPNPWFFRAISPDKDRTDALARWAKQDLKGEPILVVHEVTPPDEVAGHPPLYGESAGRDFLNALQEGTEKPYPYELITFDRDDVLSRALKQKSAALLQNGSVGAAAILSPTTNIIEIGTYLRQQQRGLPIYIISPGRDLFERSSLRAGVKAVTDTGIEDADEPELAAFRRQYRRSFPYDTEDPVYQYATFAYDAGRILVAALRSDAATAAANGDLGQLRDVVRQELRNSRPRSDLLMSSGNFVLNNDLCFKPYRRVLVNSEWKKVSSDDLREAVLTGRTADSSWAGGTAGFDAFLSYRHGDPDEEFTRKLHQRLLSAGFKVALDRVDFFPACTFLEEMERCVKNSRFTIAVISRRYFESGNTEEEAIISRVLGMDERKRRLIPLIFETATMPAWLYGIVGIDFSRDDPDFDPYERLISALRDPRGDR
jgi:ABC-type branched-subunit amino acid transport system substrate-binding protein